MSSSSKNIVENLKDISETIRQKIHLDEEMIRKFHEQLDNISDAECIWINDLYYVEDSSAKINKRCDYFKIFFKKEYSAALREMKIRIYNAVILVKSSTYHHLESFSLLFGLCSSRSSYIIKSFPGALYFRIPSLIAPSTSF